MYAIAIQDAQANSAPRGGDVVTDEVSVDAGRKKTGGRRSAHDPILDLKRPDFDRPPNMGQRHKVFSRGPTMLDTGWMGVFVAINDQLLQVERTGQGCGPLCR